MMTRYEASLDGKMLSDIDPAIYILDIAYGATRFSMAANDKPGRNGQRVTDRRARSTSVTISFAIRDQNTEKRQEICMRVQEWAMKGGYLTTGDKPGKRLAVICDSLPAIDSALKWTKALKMTLTAYEQPLWEDECPRIVGISGTSAQKSMYVPGIGAMARVEAEVKNVSGDTLDALTLTAGGTTFDFTGLALADGETLEIGYDESGLLSILAGGVSKMRCRTAQSDDDLMIKTGEAAQMRIDSGGDVSAIFKARGLWL